MKIGINIHENMFKYVKYRYKHTWKYVEICINMFKIGRNKLEVAVNM